jgi:outer membrane protein assembly factor BamD (BamD/ComL family)
VSLLILALVSGCARFWAERLDGGPESRIAEAEKLAQEKKFPQSLAAYKKILQDYPESEWSARVRFEIALVYASTANPQRDYSQALREFEEFLTLHPGHERAAEANTWKNLIKSFLEVKKENEQLRKNIEELKQLDLRQEEKRNRRR